MSIFTCCEREDESKYIHPCSCPSASVVCESEEINPTLCGFSEYRGGGITPSVPPLKYSTETFNEERIIKNWSCICDAYKVKEDLNYNISIAKTFDTSEENCATSTGSPVQFTNTKTGYGPDYDEDSVCVGSKIIIGPSTYYYNLVYEPNAIYSPLNSTVSTTVSQRIIDAGSFYYFDESSCGGSPYAQRKRIKTWTLSVPDTEALAIARETPVTGNSCSSLWETRSTGFSFIDRTSGYTIECSGLIVGLEYEVTPSIRKRTAVIGSYGAWEDVTVSPATFTATDTTKTIDNGGDPIELDHVQGYEYQITGANIEKKA
jgi:hypothetical protein